MASSEALGRRFISLDARLTEEHHAMIGIGAVRSKAGLGASCRCSGADQGSHRCCLLMGKICDGHARLQVEGEETARLGGGGDGRC